MSAPRRHNRVWSKTHDGRRLGLHERRCLVERFCALGTDTKLFVGFVQMATITIS
jgi:hypothetical protein